MFVITSGTTASASELLINGLRGIGIEVNTIGLRTLGKNAVWKVYASRSCDMCSHSTITFYCEKRTRIQGLRRRLPRDLELDETTIFGDFGTSADYLSRAALQWADTGQKPSTDAPEAPQATINTLDVTDNRQTHSVA